MNTWQRATWWTGGPRPVGTRHDGTCDWCGLQVSARLRVVGRKPRVLAVVRLEDGDVDLCAHTHEEQRAAGDGSCLGTFLTEQALAGRPT